MAPRLSVIVPIYNVERYLPACLDSLAAQTFRDLEVLMVDDGSPDGSAAIAEAYAARDSRFRLIRKENAGLGAARNTGIAHLAAEAEFLTFVDSDDVIPPDAYRLMVASLDETGSDFATGNVFHLKGEKSWQVPLLKMLAGREARQRTHISRYGRLVADRIACNKVFRRDFWDKHGLAFPESRLYEDTPVTMRAHYLAEAVDVISEPCYYWRLREGESAPSITQRRTDPAGVRDRTTSVLEISTFLAEQPGETFARLKREYDSRVLMDDLRLFLNVVPDGDEEYRAEFLRSANRFLDHIDPEVVMALPAQLRVQWLLVRKHRLDELITLLAGQRRKEAVEVSGLVRKYAAFPSLAGTDLGIPRRALRIDQDLEMRAPLQEVSWADGKLVLSGHAWIDKIGLPSRRSSVKVLQLRKDRSRRRLLLPVRNTERPGRTTDSGQDRYNYDWSGWEATLDPARLRKGGAWQEGLWHVGLGLYASGLIRRAPVQSSGGAACNFPPYHWLSPDFRLLPSVEGGVLKLRVERVRALVTGHALEGDRLRVTGEIKVPLADGERVVLRVKNQKGAQVHEFPVTVTEEDGTRRFSAEVPVADVALLFHEGVAAKAQPESRTWSTALVATDAGGRERQFSTVLREGLADTRFNLPASLGEQAEGCELAVVGGHNGYLKLAGRTRRALIEHIGLRDGLITLTARTDPRLTGSRFLLRPRNRFEERFVEPQWGEDGRFEVAFDPSVLGGGGNVPLRAGRWNLFLRPADGESADVPFVTDRLAADQFPLRAELGGRLYLLENRWADFPQLNCRSELSDLERGPYRQRQLRAEVYEPLRREPLKDQVFYLSYNGKQFSDSPRAMYEELVRRGCDLKHLWAVRDGQVLLPEGVEPVRMWGREWYEALASSRYIVTNGHLPDWIERRPGQVIVETWHGTMLKKIGHDIDTLHFDRRYQEKLALEAKQWSLLVSSNRFSTPILQRAFSYDGEILEAGYPRNDYLYAADGDRIAARVRRELGLPAGKKVVLYAPTWRDDQSHSAGQYLFDLRIDLEDAQRRLGDDHVLLIRRHSNVVDAVPGAGNGFVWDVSEYPDIADLYLAADIMITDYSSVMFDYAHLKRPMLFFTYDLEHYRDTLRGFYFDFEQDSPGPLVFTSKELVDAIRDIDAVSAEYQDRFDRFHHLFCDLDDGNASARVVDRMLEQSREL
ncbi:bifunctional glycosyltransferase/CDP-glycerol:glycerophosphate glycerophosphotransferase [Streptomyces sp. V3I7]|uniref:bifunctional glycosyltransferase/CDP-glycerol:glycerophosphate glycerophosphotransferase n=1 Tax=Streptomyces sp. V3I7 TaxID=3042278 RepID=UPI00278445A3|nr:bifunctional glycosyltransferase/CDP-glycerol:glycerophosphate glycerophosphotransferase [Streptomyces sp. V3I7]MDQ0990890.1 CDP-glycerol glycerophosphotransferase [Streptomyces sp. V3I7]